MIIAPANNLRLAERWRGIPGEAMKRPLIQPAGAKVAVIWPDKEPIFLEPEQAIQMSADRSVIDTLRFTALEVLGRVSRKPVPIEGEKVASHEDFEEEQGK